MARASAGEYSVTRMVSRHETFYQQLLNRKPSIRKSSDTLSTAGQVVKLSLDATVQADVSDGARGRVFALYDTVFNVGYVLAVAVTATVVPTNGRAPDLLLFPAAIYLTAALLHTLIATPSRPVATSSRHGDISG